MKKWQKRHQIMQRGCLTVTEKIKIQEVLVVEGKDDTANLRNDSRKRREYLGEKLRIGYSNGKQLLKRLELFGITLAEVEEVMEKYTA